MTILHCLNHFLPHQVAGTEVYTMALCHGLLERGINASVAIPNYGSNATDCYTYAGITVHRFAENTLVDRKLKMGFRVPDGVQSFVGLLQNLKPDIVHFQELAGSNGFTLAHVEAAAKMNIKVITTFHLPGYSCKSKTLVYKDKTTCDGIIREKQCTKCMLSLQSPSPLSDLLSVSSSALYKLKVDLSPVPGKLFTALGYPFIIKRLREDLLKLVQCSDRLVVLTDWYKNILLENGIADSKIVVNKQGVIEQAAVQDPPARTNNKVKLIFVGRISAFKGLHLLLEAMRNVKSRNIQLDVFGYDPEDEYSKKILSDIQLMNNVEWKGGLSPDSVVSVMKQYDALILPSTFSEMSPLVIQEAFSAGIPVVASNVYGNAEQINDGVNGWLFKFKDADDLRKRLQQFAENPAWIVGAKKKVSAPRRFEEVVTQYLEIYTSVLAPNVPA